MKKVLLATVAVSVMATTAMAQFTVNEAACKDAKQGERADPGPASHQMVYVLCGQKFRDQQAAYLAQEKAEEQLRQDKIRANMEQAQLQKDKLKAAMEQLQLIEKEFAAKQAATREEEAKLARENPLLNPDDYSPTCKTVKEQVPVDYRIGLMPGQPVEQVYQAQETVREQIEARTVCDKLKTEYQYRKNEEDNKRRAIAEAKPGNKLLRAYSNYIYLKLCHDVREGYVVQYVNDQEMERVDSTTKRIVEAATKEDASINTDDVWNAALTQNNRELTKSGGITMGVVQAVCRWRLDLLFNASATPVYPIAKPQ
jgi:hypothetical protein